MVRRSRSLAQSRIAQYVAMPIPLTDELVHPIDALRHE